MLPPVLEILQYDKLGFNIRLIHNVILLVFNPRLPTFRFHFIDSIEFETSNDNLTANLMQDTLETPMCFDKFRRLLRPLLKPTPYRN